MGRASDFILINHYIRNNLRLVIAFPVFNKIALKTDIDSKLTSSRDLGIEPGDEGITLSRLAPIGKARIKGINVEAKSQDELIDENTPIVVIRVDSYNVIVRPKEETNIHA